MLGLGVGVGSQVGVKFGSPIEVGLQVLGQVEVDSQDSSPIGSRN